MRLFVQLACSGALPLILVLAGVASSGAEEDNEDHKELAASEPSDELKYEDWAPVHYQAYDTEGHYQRPEQVFELLQQLRKIYEPFTNEQTNGRKEMVRKLIQAADMNPRLCHREYMRDFDALYKRHSPYRKTMMPYLGHHFAMFIAMCEEYVLHNLHTNVGLIKEEFRTDMDEMARIVAETEINGFTLGYGNLGKLWLHFDHLIEGIMTFMEHKFGTKLDAATFVKPRDGKKKFLELYETHIGEMCRAWVRATDPTEALEEYDIFLKLDHDELRWMIYGHMCGYLQRERKRIMPKLYRQFKRTVSRFPKFRVKLHRTLRRFNCFDDTH